MSLRLPGLYNARPRPVGSGDGGGRLPPGSDPDGT